MSYFECAISSLFDFSDFDPREFRHWLCSKNTAKVKTSWESAFKEDIAGRGLSYAISSPRKTPELEDELVAFVERTLPGLKPIQGPATPILCLSHDIDYLKPTLQLRLKNALGRKKTSSSNPSPKTYLDSIFEQISWDRKISEKHRACTLFASSVFRKRTHWISPFQWLVDPSYRVIDSEFQALLKSPLFDVVELGLHGSFFSLSHDLLTEEKVSLEQATHRPILVGRQHWLRLPNEQAFETILKSGITVDSSLGWNGACGFRGGFSRPFALAKSGNSFLWEIPLLLMDGPLFDDLKLSPSQVIAQSIELLREVKMRKGCVSIDWHDRSAAADYSWYHAYQEITTWAKEEGFQMMALGDAVKEFSGGNQ